MRRTLLASAAVAVGLMMLWTLWFADPPSEPAPAGAVAERPARRTAPPRAITTRTAQVEDPVARDRDEIEPDAAQHERDPAFEAAFQLRGKIHFRVETDRGDAVDRWFVDSPDCGLSWSSRLAELPLMAPPGACTFRAWRFDGALKARSLPVLTQVLPGEDIEVLLELPSERTGGLGVQIREHDQGIEILRVVPGAPADQMGLEAGDLIVEVDGVDTVDLALDDFIATMTGPEGSEVAFAVAWEGDTGTVYEDLTLTRGYLDSGSEPAPELRGARFAERGLDALELQR